MRFGLLALLGLFWSVRLTAMKSAGLAGVHPDVVISIAAIGIAGFFSLAALWRRRLPPTSPAALRFYAMSAAAGFIAPFFLESVIAPNLPVFIFIVIIATMPLITLALSVVSQVEALDGRNVAAAVLGFVAAAILLFDTAMGPDGNEAELFWALAAFGVPLLYACNTVYVAARWPAGPDALDVAFAQAAVVSVAAAAGWLVLGDTARLGTAAFDVWALGLIILSEGFALLIYLHLVRSLGASFVALANYLSIFFAALLGRWLFGDPLTVLALLAAGVLLAALALRHRVTRS
ncbi:MAG: DMT family transporter [Pseudomonadota bacterium]